MPKFVADACMDAALDNIANNAATVTVCTQYPTTYAQATSTYMLVTHALTSGDFSKANGDVSGRKLTMAEQALISATSSGNGTHVAVCSSNGILAVTTCTSQTITAGNPVTIPATDVWEINDPT